MLRMSLITLSLSLILLTQAHGQQQPINLTASWYSTASLIKEGTYKYSKGVMANGKQFKDTSFTCASWDFPLGTRLEVSSLVTQRKVLVTVTDRTARRFKGLRIDLSKGAFNQIAPLEWGITKVSITQLERVGI